MPQVCNVQPGFFDDVDDRVAMGNMFFNLAQGYKDGVEKTYYLTCAALFGDKRATKFISTSGINPLAASTLITGNTVDFINFNI